MSTPGGTDLKPILERHEAAVLTNWLTAQKAAPTYRPDLIKEAELREQCREFLRALILALQSGSQDTDAAAWKDVRELLASISRSRGKQGFTSTATVTFVFSLKEPLFALLRQELANDLEALAEQTWAMSALVDRLGLYVSEVYQQTRESLIQRQQEEMLELSTPVVKLWEGVLALPLIGTLDSARSQTIMENLLQRIVDSGSETAIIDITGVSTMDTLTAQHLLKTVAAARLMGADCIISGIRPQIAQTIVHLGVDLSGVTTKATMADAFVLALKRTGFTITRPAVGR